MKLTGPRYSVETGFTAAGQLYLKQSGPAGTLIKTTRNPLRFLQLLFSTPNTQVDDHLRQPKQPHQYDYCCVYCKEGFDRGHGVKIDKFLFCHTCYDTFGHFEYFRQAERMNDAHIWDLTENYTTQL